MDATKQLGKGPTLHDMCGVSVLSQSLGESLSSVQVCHCCRVIAQFSRVVCVRHVFFCFLHCMVFLSKYIALSFRDCFPPKGKTQATTSSGKRSHLFPRSERFNCELADWPSHSVPRPPVVFTSVEGVPFTIPHKRRAMWPWGFCAAKVKYPIAKK